MGVPGVGARAPPSMAHSGTPRRSASKPAKSTTCGAGTQGGRGCSRPRGRNASHRQAARAHPLQLPGPSKHSLRDSFGARRSDCVGQAAFATCAPASVGGHALFADAPAVGGGLAHHAIFQQALPVVRSRHKAPSGGYRRCSTYVKRRSEISVGKCVQAFRQLRR
ncbi:unnamed protein product [Amoebophrya sp. A120]|nr:unnamed protein product [Amoebophrya sp. A120]|eukprot:GSA120T00017682001.1